MRGSLLSVFIRFGSRRTRRPAHRPGPHRALAARPGPSPCRRAARRRVRPPAPRRSPTHRALTQYIVDRWDTDAGLPHDKVQSIAQGADGFLWVATEGGIARFDGVRFLRFAPPEAPQLGTISARALLAASDGSIWIGTDEGSVYRRKDGVLSRLDYQEKPEPSIVRVFREDASGTVWVGSSTVLYRAQGGLLVRALQLDGRIFDIQVDPRGGLLLGGAGKVLRLHPDGRLEDLSASGGFPDVTVYAVRPYRGELWVATTAGLHVLRSGAWRRENSRPGSRRRPRYRPLVNPTTRSGSGPAAACCAGRPAAQRVHGREGLSDEEVYASTRTTSGASGSGPTAGE